MSYSQSSTSESVNLENEEEWNEDTEVIEYLQRESDKVLEAMYKKIDNEE